jgi:predicted aspartyl protease
VRTFRLHTSQVILIKILAFPQKPLLGVETLEALGLKLNHTTRKLEIARPYTTLLVYGAGSEI